MKRLFVPTFLLGVLAAAAGCGDAQDLRFSEPRALPPVPVGARVAYVDAANAQAFVIDPAAAELEARMLPVGTNPLLAVARPGRDELLVLAHGLPDQRGVESEPASLTVVPTEPGKPVRRHPLGSRFSALAVSPDGRFAVFHFDPARTDTSSTLLVNPNEVAVVDLDSSLAAAPSRALRSYGGVPQAVVFSPPLAFEGRMLRLAVVLSDNYLTLFDLENDRTEITVSLTRADEPRTIRPVQVLFDAADPTIFVRAEGTNDVVTLHLVPAPQPRPDRGNDFRPVLSLLGSGGRPSDMALYTASEGPRLLLLTPDTSEAAVIDARTSRVVTFALEAQAERILLYEGMSPAENQRRPRALLLAPGGGQIGFLDLDRLEELRGRSLELRPMSSQVSQFLPLADRGVVVANHGFTRAGNVGFSVIDLDRRTVSPLVSEPVADLQPGPAPSDEMWLVPGSKTRLGRLVLSRLTASEVRLDMPAERVLPLPASAGGKRFVVVDHGRSSGAITVLDAEKPERATARSLIGFLYTNLLDRSSR